MDIPSPQGPINSWREFAVHLLTIIIGILIALSLDGLVELHHHRALVDEAKRNIHILIEIRANTSELATGQRELQTSDEQLQHILGLIHRIQTDRSVKPGSITFNWTVTELHETSWNTANSTGAVSHMGYDQVNRYTRVYDLQREFMSLQQRGFQSSVAVQALSILLSRNFKVISNAELGEAERTAGLALANARAEEQVGKALEEQYAKFR